MGRLKVHHTSIVVSDLERSLAFYERVFGLRPEQVLDVPASGLRLAFLPIGDSKIELLCYNREGDRPAPGVTDHLAIEVDDAASFVKQLVEQGLVASESTPRGGPGGSQIFFFNGPDGERLELFQDSREK